MPSIGFEHTIPASERAKTVHALDCSATVTGISLHYITLIVFALSNIGIVGSNPTQGMDVWLHLLCVCVR
jgi:hypothetical protein